ncbi:Zinc finger protein ZPR1, partial [Smittium mucronatum]
LTYGTLGGRFTTIEGLLRQVYEDLDRDTPFTGDSSTESRRAQFAGFLKKLEDTYNGLNLPITLVLDDPVSNSYVQNLYAPDPDPNMFIETYERTFEQNEDLGLNDINVDNYAE